ncbi:MAG: GNAT family N-acetyltransferase [Deltaproteobacteria bacterium]|nr:GNAT family N-acetyltransferase [Deltaproteobacteria bacterium]
MTSASTPIEVRFARAGDRQVLIELCLKLLQHLDQFEHDILPSLENAEWMVDVLFLPAATREEGILIAWDKDKAVGAIFWAIQNLPYQMRFKTAYGYGTYVDPNYQNQKVGTLLRQKAIQALKKLGVQKLLGMVHFANEISVKASDRLGFKPHARLDLLDLEQFL